MTRTECQFERGDFVWIKGDKYAKHVVLGVLKNADGSFWCRLSQVGLGITQTVTADDLELAY